MGFVMKKGSVSRVVSQASQVGASKDACSSLLPQQVAIWCLLGVESLDLLGRTPILPQFSHLNFGHTS